MIKTIDVTNITDEMVEVAAASAQLRAMTGITEHTALIRGSILAALIMAPTVEPAQAVGKVVTVGGYPDDSQHMVEWLVKHKNLRDGQLLYTAPPAIDETPKPLTQQEIIELLPEYQSGWSIVDFGIWVAREIERAHGIAQGDE